MTQRGSKLDLYKYLCKSPRPTIKIYPVTAEWFHMDGWKYRR